MVINGYLLPFITWSRSFASDSAVMVLRDWLRGTTKTYDSESSEMLQVSHTRICKFVRLRKYPDPDIFASFANFCDSNFRKFCKGLQGFAQAIQVSQGFFLRRSPGPGLPVGMKASELEADSTPTSSKRLMQATRAPASRRRYPPPGGIQNSEFRCRSTDSEYCRAAEKQQIPTGKDAAQTFRSE